LYIRDVMAQPDNGSPEFWAAQRPGAPAVIHGDTALTYQQWNDAADQVAEGLAQRGLVS
jgi:long-chain acyl-CoA synthetase